MSSPLHTAIYVFAVAQSIASPPSYSHCRRHRRIVDVITPSHSHCCRRRRTVDVVPPSHSHCRRHHHTVDDILVLTHPLPPPPSHSRFPALTHSFQTPPSHTCSRCRPPFTQPLMSSPSHSRCRHLHFTAIAIATIAQSMASPLSHNHCIPLRRTVDVVPAFTQPFPSTHHRTTDAVPAVAHLILISTVATPVSAAAISQ